MIQGREEGASKTSRASPRMSWSSVILPAGFSLGLIFLLCLTLTPLSHAAVTVDDVDKL